MEIKRVESPVLDRVYFNSVFRPEEGDEVFTDGAWVYIRKAGESEWGAIPASTCFLKVELPDE